MGLLIVGVFLRSSDNARMLRVLKVVELVLKVLLTIFRTEVSKFVITIWLDSLSDFDEANLVHRKTRFSSS